MLTDSEIRLSDTGLDGEIAQMKNFRIQFLFNAFLFFPREESSNVTI